MIPAQENSITTVSIVTVNQDVLAAKLLKLLQPELIVPAFRLLKNINL